MAPEATTRYSLRLAVAAWWRESLRYQGVWRTLAGFARALGEMLRDLTPARRRLRFGDLDYDCDERVDTTWANVRLGTRVRELFTSRQYQATDPALFRENIGELGIDYARFTFVDLGCGKGRALLLASEFPFRRIVGVEVLPELLQVAERNARVYRGGAEQHRIQLWCGDARHFTFPPEPLVVFLFDPFPEHILEQVIARLQSSAHSSPRELLLVYQNPISEHVLANSGWLQRVRGNVQYAVYRKRFSR